MKGVIGILTGGGDVPGLNPAIRAITFRAIREGYRVVGIKNGWEGTINIDRTKSQEDQKYIIELDEVTVNRYRNVGGTFLHTSRTNPKTVKKDNVPEHLKESYCEEVNDLTSEVLKNLEHAGIDYLIPIGGDDTLGYAAHLHDLGVKIVAIPKTMDNDVPGTDYCIGFSTCVTRTIEFTNQLRTCASSHQRFLVVEVFGRYAGYTAMLPTAAGAADRCVIPEHKFNMEHLTELMIYDRNKNPEKLSVVMVSEGAMFEGGEMIFETDKKDSFGHKKLGGIGDVIAGHIHDHSEKYNHGKKVDVINQRLSYLVRSGSPDAIDSLVSTAYGNLAMTLIKEKKFGRMVAMKYGRYESVPINIVQSTKKKIDVAQFYNTERYHPIYTNVIDRPMWIMTSD